MHEVYDAIELKDPSTWDNVNILEEFGDQYWYLAIAADELKITSEIDDFKVEQIDQITLCNPMSKYIFIRNLRQLQSGLLDTCKKVMFYGKSLDLNMVTENIFTQYLMIRGIIELISQDPETIDSVMHINLAKLKQRYPDKFDGYKAEIRDLEAERAILEKI
jgi:NTP pyrophosphatase (non-canonical NTP hydrolase)